ncbi:hypothetical protein HELRODRAFT_115195, partial [Helobdella robusta]|uniref:protein acetyllysine N-acetyltransferase n=1 Tax=Helobdella robusta TaxID=6412 RepID=T1EG71_HELRO
MERKQEVEDISHDLDKKCRKLASIIEHSKSLIIYSGAGISTAASIPDYRGPNGIWTLLKQGKQCLTSDLSLAEPTLTHMSIAELYKKGYVKRVVSQNCDGLHLRSGLPRSALSELHGNMYIEVCRTCQPRIEYLRLFDVTERTAMRRHKTSRCCHQCRSALHDTIIHFGEKSPFQSPYNWKQASSAANKADVILCLGTSLKVLKKYDCLWVKHKPLSEQPKLVIVNLQWTPKDKHAVLKINGRCDDVMMQLMNLMNIQVPRYDRYNDPLFHLSTPLRPNELDSTTKKLLSLPDGFVKKTHYQLRFKVEKRAT